MCIRKLVKNYVILLSLNIFLRKKKILNFLSERNKIKRRFVLFSGISSKIFNFRWLKWNDANYKGIERFSISIFIYCSCQDIRIIWQFNCLFFLIYAILIRFCAKNESILESSALCLLNWIEIFIKFLVIQYERVIKVVINVYCLIDFHQLAITFIFLALFYFTHSRKQCIWNIFKRTLFVTVAGHDFWKWTFNEYLLYL